MKSTRAKIRDRRADEASHGRVLLMTISTLKGQIARLHREISRERNTTVKARLVRELDALRPVLELRENELKEALEAAETEKAQIVH